MFDPSKNYIKPIIHYLQSDADNIRFEFPFPFTNPEDIHLIIDQENIDIDCYNVLKLDAIEGGYLELNQPPSIGAEIIIWRQIPPTLNTAFIENGVIRALTLNDALERLTLLQQDFYLLLENCLQIPINNLEINLNLPNPAANKALIWNEAGDQLINSLYAPDDSEKAAIESKKASEAANSSAIAAENHAKTAGNYADISKQNALAGKPGFYGFMRMGNDLGYQTQTRDEDETTLHYKDFRQWFLAISGIQFSITPNGHLRATL